MSTVKANTYQDASGGSNATFSGVASPPNSMGFRNRLINSAMVIDQRNAGASVTANSATNPYLTDRWRSLALTGSGQFSAQQSTVAPLGFTNSLLFTSLAATSVGASDGFGFRQPIEGLNCSDLGFGTASASSVTLSFWVRSSLTGTFGGSVANSNATRSYPFSYTISSANTWEQKTITVPGDTTGTWATDNTTGINVWFSLGMGSTRSGTAGAWAAADYRSATGATSVVGTNGATFYITGVQLEAGTVASPFERRDYGRELMMCQRYYQQLGGTADATIGSGLSTSTSAAAFYVKYPVTMRSAPAVSGTSFNVTDGLNYNAAVSSLGTVNAGVDSARVFVNTNAVMTQYRPALLQPIGSTSFLALSSEL